MGAAEGHDADYGRFLVATGPVQFEGSDATSTSRSPAEDQKPGRRATNPARSIVLVRNPNYGPRRPTICVRPTRTGSRSSIGGDNDDLYKKINAGRLDFVVDGAVPPDDDQEYTTDPDLQDRLQRRTRPTRVRYVSFNLATPPFDDIHVRKAVNYAIDKAGMRQLRAARLTGDIAGHISSNRLQNNLPRPTTTRTRRPTTRAT